jgi:alanine dehydrogenase
MLIVPERLIADLVSPEAAYEAIEATFAAMARGMPTTSLSCARRLGEGRQYGFKSGLDRAGNLLGVKAGGYFPGNADAASRTTSPRCSCSIPTAAS